MKRTALLEARVPADAACLVHDGCLPDMSGNLLLRTPGPTLSSPEFHLVPGTAGETPALAVSRTTIRFVIVHPNRLLREAIAFVLSRQVGSVVVASVGGTGELVDRLDLLRADVYVIDLGASGGRGLDDTREVRRRFPEAKILMTGLSGTEAEILTCAEAGAGGYLQHRRL